MDFTLRCNSIFNPSFSLLPPFQPLSLYADFIPRANGGLFYLIQCFQYLTMLYHAYIKILFWMAKYSPWYVFATCSLSFAGHLDCFFI